MVYNYQLTRVAVAAMVNHISNLWLYKNTIVSVQ